MYADCDPLMLQCELAVSLYPRGIVQNKIEANIGTCFCLMVRIDFNILGQISSWLDVESPVGVTQLGLPYWVSWQYPISISNNFEYLTNFHKPCFQRSFMCTAFGIERFFT